MTHEGGEDERVRWRGAWRHGYRRSLTSLPIYDVPPPWRTIDRQAIEATILAGKRSERGGDSGGDYPNPSARSLELLGNCC